MTMAEKDKDWSSRENILNPHHDYRVRQVENIDRQMKSLTERRAQLVKEIERGDAP